MHVLRGPNASHKKSGGAMASCPPLSYAYVIMVKGLFTPLRFPYSHFPCTSITGDLLFDPFWEAIYRLERMYFKVSVLLKIYIIIMHVLGACCYI